MKHNQISAVDIPPKDTTDETVVLLSREKTDDQIRYLWYNDTGKVPV